MTKKESQWFLGYKAHIGADKDTGLVQTVKTAAANIHNANMTSELLRGKEEELFGDSGYTGAGKRGRKNPQ